MRYTLCFFAPLVSIGLFFSPLTYAEPQTVKLKPSLRVGVVLGLTGAAAIHAAAVQKGLELAKEELVRAGWNVDLVYEDDQTQSPKTVSAFQSLIARGFKLFVGPMWDFQIIAAQPVLKANGALTMAATASTEVGGGPGPGVYFLVPPRPWQLKPLRNFIENKKLRRASCGAKRAVKFGEHLYDSVLEKVPHRPLRLHAPQAPAGVF